jgi:tetratricopeptide (TPR) repeat protein
MSVLKLAPNFAQKSEVLYKLAVIFGKTYQLEQAINYFKMAMMESNGAGGSSRRLDIHIKMGICYLEKKDLGEALKYFESALSMGEQNYRALQHLAWCELALGHYPAALDYVTKALSLKDSDGDSHYIRGRILLASDKGAEAKEAFDKAIARSQPKAIYYGSLGVLNCLIKAHSEAFDNFLKATHIDSQIADIWFDIGILYEIHQQFSEALVAYQRALDVCPDYPEATNRKRAVANDQQTAGALPQFVHPDFHIPDTMVPQKAYQKNAKIKKASEPALAPQLGVGPQNPIVRLEPQLIGALVQQHRPASSRSPRLSERTSRAPLAFGLGAGCGKWENVAGPGACALCCSKNRRGEGVEGPEGAEGAERSPDAGLRAPAAATRTAPGTATSGEAG